VIANSLCSNSRCLVVGTVYAVATNGVLLFASLLLRKSKAMDGSSSGREIRQARPLIIRDGAACIRMDFLLAAPTRRPHGKTQPLAKAKKSCSSHGPNRRQESQQTRKPPKIARLSAVTQIGIPKPPGNIGLVPGFKTSSFMHAASQIRE